MENFNRVLISGFIGLALSTGEGGALAKGGKPAFLTADAVPETIETETEVSDEVAETTATDLLVERASISEL